MLIDTAKLTFVKVVPIYIPTRQWLRVSKALKDSCGSGGMPSVASIEVSALWDPSTQLSTVNNPLWS